MDAGFCSSVTVFGIEILTVMSENHQRKTFQRKVSRYDRVVTAARCAGPGFETFADFIHVKSFKAGTDRINQIFGSRRDHFFGVAPRLVSES